MKTFSELNAEKRQKVRKNRLIRQLRVFKNHVETYYYIHVKGKQPMVPRSLGYGDLPNSH